MIPSNLATAILRTVRDTKKKECKATMKASLDRNEGIAIRNKIARS